VRTWGRVVIIVAAVTLIGRIAAAGGLRKVWDFNTGDGVRDGTGGSGAALGVFALSFSPDGQSIAAVVGRSAGDEFVLILDAGAPQANNKRLNVNPRIWGLDSTFPNQLSWSPSGQQLLLGRTIVELSNGNTCSLPEGIMPPEFLFAGPTQVAGKQWKPMRLSFFDLDCHATAQVDFGNDLWQIYGASADRGLLLIWQQHRHSAGSIQRVVSLLEAGSKKIIRELPWPDGERFAYSSDGVCGVGGRDWHRTVSCVDVDTDKQLAVTTGWNAPDIQTALHARRAVLSDYSRRLDWIDGVWRVGSLKKRVVWDFGTGKELASWHPKSQSVFMGAYPITDVGHAQPFQFAISPDGEYVVEGGAGVLTLYKIEP
jgi:WD40 repeat protein